MTYKKRLKHVAPGLRDTDAASMKDLRAVESKIDNITDGTFANPVKFTDTTDTSSGTTGAVVIDGGLGIAKKVFVADTTQSTTKDTGAVIVDGGVGIEKNLFVGGTINGKVTVTDTGGAYATPIVLTTAQSGAKILVDDAAGLDFRLPAIAAADIGTTFEFFVTVSIISNLFRVTSATGDLMTGSILLVDDTAAYTAPQAIVLKPATSFLVMSMNGTTSGGKIGTRVKFTATSATQWFVEGIANGSGVLAGIFS